MSEQNKLASEKVLDRIRKLLAMSKDTTSPNEAAIAAKRARHLMDKYQLSEVDFDNLADSDFKEIQYKTYRKYNKALGILAVAIAKLNDCQAVLRDNSYGSKIEVIYNFQGMVADSVTCLEMMLYLRTELYHQQESVKGKRQKNAYEMGFAVGIADQVKEILKERASQRIEATGKSLVVVKSELVANHFGTVKYTKSKNGYRSDNAYSSGYQAGRSAGLSRQVGAARGQARLK